MKKVKVTKTWEDLDESETKALRFNNINEQRDLEDHNKKGLLMEEVLIDFLEKVKTFGELPLTGWNNATFDNTILRRSMERYEYNYFDYFHHHSRDVMCMFSPFYEKFFLKKMKRFSLESVHRYLIGTFKSQDFHKAENDCLATLDIDLWLSKKIKSISL